MNRGYETAKSNKGVMSKSGADLTRESMGGDGESYETSDQGDRLSRGDYYEKIYRTASSPRRVTRVRVEKDDIEMSLEFAEQDLMLKQLHKRIDLLSEEAKKQCRAYWKRRMKK